MMIRVMLIDDHPVVLEGLAAILSTAPELEVVASAQGGLQALAMLEEARPDVVLLDLEMPGMDGVETLTRLREVEPGLRALVFTAYDTDERLLGAIAAGALGHLLKGAPRKAIFDAIRIVHMGGSLLQPTLAARLLTPPPAPDPGPALTPREREVLELLSRGLQNKEIAQVLGITPRTVKFHLGALFQKLDVTNRTEALAVAVSLGLVDPREAP